MTIEELLDHPCTWFFGHDPSEIAISSRIRLARNLDGIPFPAHASPEQRKNLRDHALTVLQNSAHFKSGSFFEMDRLCLLHRSRNVAMRYPIGLLRQLGALRCHGWRRE